MAFLVYEHINRINGKRYVGITHHTDDPNRRWNNGRGYFRNKHFSDAIHKYGWENFDHIILASGLNKQDACTIERMMIQIHQTQNKCFGYNITDGGEFFHHSNATKALMSKHRKGKGLRKFSEEHKRKIREHHQGGTDKKSVVCVESGLVYKSINDAARATGINKKQISGCCRNVPHYNAAGGYHWRFAMNEV